MELGKLQKIDIRKVRQQEQNDFSTYEQKQKELFLRQKHTLDLFLERNAITKKQYDKSLGDLRDKMGMHEVE